MARPIRRFRPRLEAFDERVLPSVTTNYSAANAVLVVKGDAANDVIAITDTGKGDAGAVTVFDHRVPVFTSPGLVTQIMVVTYGGADVVDYRLTGDLTTKRLVTADLGAGNDSFTATLDGQTLAATLGIHALGRAGKDTLTLNAQNVTVAAGAWVTVDLRGGMGSDTIKFNYTPNLVDPTAVVSLNADQKIR
jgi:hypothetical protein